MAFPGRRTARSRSTLPFTARHMAENTLARSDAYDALGLPLERAQAGAGRDRAVPLARRGAAALPGGGIVVNDAYNANPTSMRAALVDLVERAGGRRRVAILGEMAELGDSSRRYHDEIGALLGELGIELVVAVGEGARPYLGAGGPPSRDWIPDAAAFGSVRGPRFTRATRSSSRPPARSGSKASRPDRETGKGMVRVLIAGLVAMVIAIVIGPTFIEWLRRTGVGQQIREEGPARHIVKQGTPTMGGLLILATAVAPFLVLSLYTHARAGDAVRHARLRARSGSPTTT